MTMCASLKTTEAISRAPSALASTAATTKARNSKESNIFNAAIFGFATITTILYLAPSLFSTFTTIAPSVVGEAIDETGFSQSIEVSKLLLDTRSKYQRIQIYDAAKSYYGRVLVLDGVLQLAEGDAAAYNEMMAHVPLFQHPNPKRVLVIGGGDGYVVAEALKHPSVEQVDHVDLDGKVIEVCRQYFPQWDRSLDTKVNLLIDDGAAYCRKHASLGDLKYDVIIQDSSDPWTGEGRLKEILPSSVLYTEAHLQNVYNMLDPEHGIFAFQAEMLQIPSDIEGVAEWRQAALEAGFAKSSYGSIMIGSYPTGQIGFLLCERSSSKPSATLIRERFNGMQTHYYHPGLQTASFVLPLWAENIIYGKDKIARALNATDVCTACEQSPTPPLSLN